MPPKRDIPAPTSDRAIATALKKIYFAPGGFVGAKKLQERLMVKGIHTSVKFITDWLKQQSTHSLTVKPKKIKHYLKFESAGLNDKHVADVAYFRHESNGFTGILVVIDIYSRYAQAVPIKNKTASNIAKEYQKMLKDTKLDMPRQMITDEGTEFKGAFSKLLKDNDVNHHIATPGNHTTTAIVDRFIYLMKERLVRQMNYDKNDNWDTMLKPFVDSYNTDLHSTINVRPLDVMEDNAVPVIKEQKISKQPLLKKGAKVRVILTEQKGINRNRATDREYWSKDNSTIDEALYSPENIRYYRIKNKDGDINKHIFYHEELLPIVK
jgi:transposase InsO family protein